LSPSFQRHTTPPAWSSRPESGLNRTSAKPFSTDVLRSTHQGKVPLPDCSSTFGLLGALASAFTAQRGVPLPVTPCSQPPGSAPGESPSKLIVSANAAPAANMDAAVMHALVTIGSFPARVGSEQTWTPQRL